jgi:hypothetical protein
MPNGPRNQPAKRNRPLEEHTRDELYNQAKSLGIAGRGRMSKEALITAIREQAQAPKPKPARDAPATSYISMHQQ